VPVSDACFRLPGFFLQSVCHAKLEVARQCAPHGLWNFVEVTRSFQAASMRLHVLVVVIGHEIARRLGRPQSMQARMLHPAIGIDGSTITYLLPANAGDFYCLIFSRVTYTRRHYCALAVRTRRSLSFRQHYLPVDLKVPGGRCDAVSGLSAADRHCVFSLGDNDVTV